MNWLSYLIINALNNNRAAVKILNIFYRNCRKTFPHFLLRSIVYSPPQLSTTAMMLIVVNDCLETGTHIIHILFYSLVLNACFIWITPSSVGKKVKTGKNHRLGILLRISLLFAMYNINRTIGDGISKRSINKSWLSNRNSVINQVSIE